MGHDGPTGEMGSEGKTVRIPVGLLIVCNNLNILVRV